MRPVESPRTKYARSADGTFIAYQVFGDGPDLLLAQAWISHLELSWESDESASWLRALGRFARVIFMDQRGIGLSDRMTQMIDLETRVDDVRAVLDAAGSQRPVLYGQGLDGGAICAMFLGATVLMATPAPQQQTATAAVAEQAPTGQPTFRGGGSIVQSD